MRIHVTQWDIREAHRKMTDASVSRNASRDCVVATALARITGEPWSVGYAVAYPLRVERSAVGLLPPFVTDHIHKFVVASAFHAFGVPQIAPFMFEMDLSPFYTPAQLHEIESRIGRVPVEVEEVPVA